jgi:hypothetical protein
MLGIPMLGEAPGAASGQFHTRLSESMSGRIIRGIA